MGPAPVQCHPAHVGHQPGMGLGNGLKAGLGRGFKAIVGLSRRGVGDS